jgi:hypothetical protein
MSEYQLHPLCSLFPRMAGAEFETLVADIKANGQREPIIIHDGMILDGGNRYRACIEAGIPPETMQFGGGNLVSYVLSANLHRRHLSAGQQAAIVASCQDWQKAAKQGAARDTDKGVRVHLSTVEDRAKVSGASISTQKRADKVAKADPELAKQVGLGEKTLPQAVEEVTGKRPGTKPKKPKKPAKQKQKSEPIIDETEKRLERANDAIDSLVEENDRYKNQLSAFVFEGSEEEKKELLGRLDAMSKELKTANAMVAAITRSRDQLMIENASLKRHVAMLQKQIKKAA